MFGVDQCRVCGKPITVPSKKARAEQENTNRKPPMAEAEWRRRGYLTCPTPRQLGKHPAHGCCFICGIKEQRKLSRPLHRLVIAIAIWLGVFVGVVALLTYMHH